MGMAKKVGKDGIDRWTSNGYGIDVEVTKKDKETAQKINDELRRAMKNDDISTLRRK